MAAIDFPASPSVGQAFTAGNGVTYTWNGLLWVASGASAGGDFMATRPTAFSLGTSASTVVFPTIASGNTNGAYNVATGVYTPSAGRYFLYALISGSNAGGGTFMVMTLRKNGTAIAHSQTSPPSGSNTGIVAVQATVDASGTDTFDVQASGTATTTTLTNAAWFGGFPISGIKGPPGDYPSGLKLYSEQVAVGGETYLQVTIPANAKRIELDWFFRSTSGVTQNFVLQCMQGATPHTASVYSWQYLYQSAATVSGGGSNSTASWPAGSGAYVAGSAKLFPQSGSSWWITSPHYGIDGSARYNQTMGGDGGLAVALTTGFRITITSSSHLAGNFLRCFTVV